MVTCIFCGGALNTLEQRRGWKCCHACWHRRIIINPRLCSICTTTGCSMPNQIESDNTPDEDHEDPLGW
jgi:hypothetical protein